MEAAARGDQEVRLGAVRAVGVPECFERGERGARLRQVANTGHHVDDRLSGKARYRGGADVMDPAVEPPCEHRLEFGALLLEAAWPLRIGVDDDQSFFRFRALLPAAWTINGSSATPKLYTPLSTLPRAW